MKLAGVFAHPDDDTYGVSGTAALHGEDPGFELTIVMATSGEAGRIADPSLATRETLGAVREEEDRASWRALGLGGAVFHFLRHPDGGLARIRRGDLVAQIAALLLDAQPDVVVTFGPDGVTGHEDHIAIGAAATEAFHIARERSDGTGFARLLAVGLPWSKLERFGELLRQRGLDPPDPAEPFAPRGVPDGVVAVTVNCSGVFRRKVDALREHRTQGELEDFPEDLWPLILSEEDFVQLWPDRERGAAPLPDIFAGL